jgi:small subunit ribosomal protein S17
MKTNRKVREGVVVSNKMQKTVVVAVERRAMDEKFKKIMKHVTKFKAHDEKNECKMGDRVQIIETRPISRDKRWRVQKILMSAGDLAEKTAEKAAV